MGREHRRVDARPGHGDHPQRRELPFGDRVGGDHLVEEGPPDAAATDGDDAHQLVVVVAELVAPGRDLVRRRRCEPGDVAGEREVLLGPVADRGQLGAEAVGDDVVGVADEDRPVPDPRVSGDVLDHLGVVVGGQEGLVLTAVGHGQEADEVGEPHVLAPFQLWVLVPEVVDVPCLVADDDVVQPFLDDLLEQHEVGDQDLVHAAQRLEAVEVVPAGLRGDVRGLVGEPPTGRVDVLTLGFEHRGDGMLGEPVDLHVGAQLLQLLGHGDVTSSMAEPDGGREIEHPLGSVEASCPHRLLVIPPSAR